MPAEWSAEPVACPHTGVTVPECSCLECLRLLTIGHAPIGTGDQVAINAIESVRQDEALRSFAS